MSRSLLVLAACCALLTACQPDLAAFAERHTRPEEREFARHYLSLIERRGVDSAFALVVPELQTPTTREQIEKASSFLAAHPVDAPQLIGVHINTMAGRRTVNLSWEYRSGEQWVLTNVAAQHQEAGSPRVVGFGVHPQERSMSELNRFTFRDRSPVHVIWLVAALLSPLVCIAAAIRIATATGMPKRWAWALASLVGLFTLSLNWTTGAVNVNIVSFTFLGAGITKAGSAAPWILTFSLPLPAILALQRYRSWRRAATAPVGAAFLGEKSTV